MAPPHVHLEAFQSLTVSDGYGPALTLDMTARTVTTSTGEQLTLDQELAEAVLAAFQADLSSDATSASLGASIAASPYANCANGGECETIRQAEMAPGADKRSGMRKRPLTIYVRRGASTVTVNPIVLPSAPLPGDEVPFPGRRRPLTTSSPSRWLPPANLYYGYTCGEIARAAMAGMLELNWQRKNRVKEIANTVRDGALSIAAGAVVGAIEALGAEILGLTQALSQDNVTMSGLGAMWGMAQCSSQTVNVGNVYYPRPFTIPSQPGGLGFGYMLVCHPETFWISFDGQNWMPVYGQYCEWYPAPL